MNKEKHYLAFLKTITKTLYPHCYRDLSVRSVRDSVKYILSLVYVAFIIMTILMLPGIARLQSYIHDQIKNFEELSFDYKMKMAKPVTFTETRPLIVFDTANKDANITNEKVLIKEEEIQYRFFGFVNKVDLVKYKNIKDNPERYSKLILYFIIALVPAMALLIYLLNIAKFLFIITAVAAIGVLIIKLIKYELTFREAFKISLYASSIYIIIEILAIPFTIVQKYLFTFSL